MCHQTALPGTDASAQEINALVELATAGRGRRAPNRTVAADNSAKTPWKTTSALTFCQGPDPSGSPLDTPLAHTACPPVPVITDGSAGAIITCLPVAAPR
jgi:hypothetical protein